jgi:hypothetical protein
VRQSNKFCDWCLKRKSLLSILLLNLMLVIEVGEVCHASSIHLKDTGMMQQAEYRVRVGLVSGAVHTMPSQVYGGFPSIIGVYTASQASIGMMILGGVERIITLGPADADVHHDQLPVRTEHIEQETLRRSPKRNRHRRTKATYHTQLAAAYAR